MNYEELKEALDYTAKHREEVLGENSAMLAIVISKENDAFQAMADGNYSYIAGAFVMAAEEDEDFGIAILTAAKMIMDNKTKLN